MNRILIMLFLLFAQWATAQTAPELQAEAKALLAKKDLKAALEKINKAIELDNRNPYLYLDQAHIYIGLRDVKMIGESYLKAVMVAPDNIDVLCDYVNFLLSLNIRQEAIPVLEKIRTLTQNVDTLMRVNVSLGGIYTAFGDFERAEEALAWCYQQDSNNAAVINNLGLIHLKTKNYPEALVYMGKVLAMDTTAVYAYSNIGYIYQGMNEYERAIPFFDKSIELTKDYELKGVAYCNRGYSRFKLGQKKAALEDLNQSINLYPTNGYAYKVRAEILLSKKKRKKACEDLQLAIKYKYTEQWGDGALELQRQYCK